MKKRKTGKRRKVCGFLNWEQIRLRCLTVEMVSGTFWKNKQTKKQKQKKPAQFIWYLAFHWCDRFLKPYSFLCSYHQLGVCGAKYLPENGFPVFFTPWPCGRENDAGIFMKTKFSRKFPTCEAPKVTANRNSCWIFLIRRVVVRAGVNCPHLWVQLVLWLICSSLCWWWFVCVYEFYRSKGSSSSEDWQCVWRFGLELFGGIPQDNPEHGER